MSVTGKEIRLEKKQSSYDLLIGNASILLVVEESYIATIKTASRRENPVVFVFRRNNLIIYCETLPSNDAPEKLI